MLSMAATLLLVLVTGAIRLCVNASQMIANLQRDRLNYEMVIVRQRKELFKLSSTVCDLTGQPRSASRMMSSPPSVLRTPVRGRTPPDIGASFDRLLDLDESLVSLDNHDTV
jgi:hypothetical protein